MEALLAERDALFDPSRTFARAPQPRPPRPYSVPLKGKLPTTGIARVVAYTFDRGGRTRAPLPAECDDVAFLPFRKDGTMCPNVVAPGAVLDDDEVRRVVGLVTAAEDALEAAKKTGHYALPARVRCGFDPHHAFAFYDAQGVLRARIVVCFTCGEWLVTPGTQAVGEGENVLMPDGAYETLRAIFDAHGEAAWSFGPKGEELRAYELATYGAGKDLTPAGIERRRKRLSAGSGAPRDVPLSSLPADGRRALCDWVAYEVEPTRERTRSRGYRCDDGTEWSSEWGDPRCATRPMTCDATVARVEDCLRELREPEDLCAGPPPAECAGLLDCLPGLWRVPVKDAGK